MATATVPPPARVTPPAEKVGRPRRKMNRTLKYLLLVLFALIVLLPAYVLLVTSFKGPSDADPSRAWFLPQTWDPSGWAKAWDTLAPALGRTFAMVIPASIISATLGSMNGYVLSKWRFPYANVVFTLILFGMFIPYQAVMIPLTQLMQGLGVPNGIPSLLVLHIVYGLPICTLIFRNYYASVPDELIEAARMDGAGLLRTYFSVILPVSTPGFVVVLIWQFTSAWNDYLFAAFFSSGRNGPVTIALSFLAGGQLTDYAASMAGALIASVPTLIVYIILGKYFVGGLMSGSVKG
ncbi:binding-protein-dependent transport system inner membrane protein [Arthrobacter crystallopoietes BAB-32]|uniref:Binding-protein-dependent transport system inner membrane protein n=1 Tax=Arthrobacter crystallopoietes BAB-32 TaxID=1246476 RepID=N1UTK1_9MICC|nr:carbohydrate ABC transporter permease [Arthrobacter crystallopoietes]EMY32385.1 binding-protein-dependent transport system inner membrane protein [Arthrobacter crystallopoietes BAB-32]